MNQPVLFALLAAVANLAGGLLVVRRARRATTLELLTGFGAGFMLAVAVLEMLPPAVGTEVGLTFVLLGYLGVHLTQHVLTPHFHFGEETHAEVAGARGVGVWALVGLLPHSFFDGVAIAGGFLEASELGILIFAAVLLHKIPTGVSLASIMLASGHSARRAVAAVAAIGVATVFGAAATPGIGVLARHGLALAAGVTIYVAASNLIPECHREQRGWGLWGVFLGVGAFYLARLLIPGG